MYLFEIKNIEGHVAHRERNNTEMLIHRLGTQTQTMVVVLLSKRLNPGIPYIKLLMMKIQLMCAIVEPSHSNEPPNSSL
jgi:hypothetical protein